MSSEGNHHLCSKLTVVVAAVVVIVAACWLHWKKEKKVEPLQRQIFFSRKQALLNDAATKDHPHQFNKATEGNIMFTNAM